jgi:hypothetical protein
VFSVFIHQKVVGIVASNMIQLTHRANKWGLINYEERVLSRKDAELDDKKEQSCGDCKRG